MALLAFLRRADRADVVWMLSLTVLAGAANALLVLAVNQVAIVVAHAERPAALSWLIYGGAFLVYYKGNKMALLRANIVIERMLRDLRLRVIDRLRRSELPLVDQLGRGHLYILLAQETNHLSLTFPMLIDAIQQAILMLASLIYLIWLSPAAALVFALFCAAGAIGFRLIETSLGRSARMIASGQARMLDAIADIIHGSKEIRLHRRRSDAVFAQYRALSGIAEQQLIMSGDHWADLLLLSSAVTYAMLGVIMFGFPGTVPGYEIIVFQLVPLILFCIAPLTRIAAMSPMFVRAEAGLQAILKVEQDLASANAVGPEVAKAQAPQFHGFEQITYTAMVFTHRSEDGRGFSVGPLNLQLSRGETVFLIGDNGSGKSTVTRLLSALYPAEAGVIRVDGRAVAGPATAGFRELFSAVFTDFYLFDRLYGLEHVDQVEISTMIERMGLAGKVTFSDGRFSQTALSTGQRKRLALIAALLEDRPIYVFDEWSAEQDVHFRAYFYNEILPGLKAAGKTVIAVTHDERFWHLADRVIRLEGGRIAWECAGSEMEPA